MTIDILQDSRPKDHGWLWALLVSIFLVLFGTFIVFVELEDRYTERLSREFQRVLLGTRQALHVWADEHVKRAEVIASNGLVIDAALALDSQKNTSPPALLKTTAMAKIRGFFLPRLANSSYEGFFVINEKNINLASSRDENVGTENLLVAQRDILSRAWAGEAVISRVQLSDVALKNVKDDPKLNSVTMFVVVPLRDQLGRIFSLLALRLDPHSSFFPILQRQQLGSTGETYAFDRRGLMLSDSRFHTALYDLGVLNVPERSAGRLHLLRTGENGATGDTGLIWSVERAIRGESGERFDGYLDYIGKQVVGAWLWDDRLSIGLVTEQAKGESHDLLYKLQITLGISALLVLGLLVAVVVTALRGRRRAKEAQDILQAIVSTASDGIVLIDQKGMIQSVNSAVTKMFGYKEAELIGQNVNMLMPAGHRERHDGYVSNYLETGHKQIIGKGRETEGLSKDGRLIPVLLTVNAFKLEDNVYFSGFLKDITELKRTETALKKASEELELMALVAEKTDNAVIVTDTEGRIVWCNPGFTSITGYEMDEVLGLRPGEFLQGEATDSATVANISSAIKDGRRIEVELLNYNKVGESYWINLEIVPVYDDAGQLQRFIALESNITAQKEMNLALQKAKEDAEHANRAKSIFLATMSHEIRTPLNGIVATMDLLSHDIELKDEQRKLVQTACTSSVTLMHIIDDILDFSKIEAGRIELDKEPFALEEMMEQVGDSLASFADQKGVELLLYCDPSLQQVFGDIVRLKQILFNLVGNAIKFTQNTVDRPGRVLVRIEPSLQDNAMVVIQVIDNGIGMNAQTQARLFSPFVQGEGDTTRRFGGTGLGLVITKRLLSLMDGAIEVRSAEDVGTTFTITLPLENVLSPHELQLSDLSNACVVLLQDDAELSLIVTEYLNSVGAACHILGADLLDGTAPICSSKCLQGNIIVLIDACADAHLRAKAVELIQRFNTTADIHFLMLERGRKRYVQRRSENELVLDINNMKRSALINAVAALAGLESPLLDNADAQELLALSSLLADIGGTEMRSVLLADDNDVNQLVISQQLNALGYSVEVADDGKEALEKWRKNQHDLVLTDCHMPELDGYELARAIRKEERKGERVPIIAITADALKGTRERCLEAGMDDYLTKPIQLIALRECMDHWYLPRGQGSIRGFFCVFRTGGRKGNRS